MPPAAPGLFREAHFTMLGTLGGKEADELDTCTRSSRWPLSHPWALTSPHPQPACHSRAPPSYTNTGLPPEGLNRNPCLVPLFSFYFRSRLSNLSPLLRMGGVLTRQEWSGEKGRTGVGGVGNDFYYLPSFLNIPRYCQKRGEHPRPPPRWMRGRLCPAPRSARCLPSPPPPPPRPLPNFEA